MHASGVTLRQAQGDCHGELVEPCLYNYEATRLSFKPSSASYSLLTYYLNGYKIRLCGQVKGG
jgi:hypothetical protein